MRHPLSSTLLLALALSACDGSGEDLEEDMEYRVKRTHANEYIPPPDPPIISFSTARAHRQEAIDKWLKANTDPAEGNEGCEMYETKPGPTGSFWVVGFCCMDFDDPESCEDVYQAVCKPGYGCLGGEL